MDNLYKEIGLNDNLKVDTIIPKEKFIKSNNIDESDEIVLQEYCKEIKCKYKLYSDYFNMEKLKEQDEMYNEIIVLEVIINNEMASYYAYIRKIYCLSNHYYIEIQK